MARTGGLILLVVLLVFPWCTDSRHCTSDTLIRTCFCKDDDNSTSNSVTTQDPFRGSIQCRNGQAFAIPLVCITTVKKNSQKITESSIVAGSCPFTGNINHTKLDGTIADLDQLMCGGKKREGQLCGRCIEGNFSMTINTPGLLCVDSNHCLKHEYTWLTYYIEEFFGITMFYLVILTLNIRVTSEAAAGSLLLAQLIALPISIIDLKRDWIGIFTPNAEKYLANIIKLMYSPFNLNLHNGIIWTACVSNLSPSNLYALQYSASFYPLILILISFAFIKLYERDLLLIVIISRPLRLLWHRFRRKIDSRATIIDIFASFLILSYTKLTHTSFLLITPSSLYDINGTFKGRVMVYDGTLPYFSHEHLPYALVAIFILCFVVIPAPLLLLFYQFRWFQKFLNCLKVNDHLLGLFVHSFQRGFKDGNDGTKDLRFFSCFQFVVRIIVFGMYASIGDYFMLFYYLNVVSIIYAFVFGVFRPYKNDYYNKAECFVGLLMSFLTATTIQNSIFLYFKKSSIYLASLIFMLVLFPALYMGCYVMVLVLKNLYRKNKTKILRRLQNNESDNEDEANEQDPLFNNSAMSTGSGRRVRRVIRNIIVNHSLNTPLNEDAPDRLNNPSDYSDMEYQWVPEHSDTDTATNTTNRSTANTGSTFPRSTYSQNNTGGSSMSTTNTGNAHSGNQPPSQKKMVRPKSLRSFKLHNLSEDHTVHPNTN